jgi:hypothetical protein
MATKDDWKAAKAAVEAIEKEREALLAPTKERYDAACDRLEMIEDECPERIGRCEGCDEPIWEGDRYACGNEDCIYLCEDCAPSWGDMLANPDQFYDDEGEYHTAETVKAAVDAHLAAGGSLEDKMVSA